MEILTQHGAVPGPEARLCRYAGGVLKGCGVEVEVREVACRHTEHVWGTLERRFAPEADTGHVRPRGSKYQFQGDPKLTPYEHDPASHPGCPLIHLGRGIRPF